MIEGMDFALEVIRPLREFGLRVSLDDFGTGYSSLNYLAQLEFDELKIDKSFVDQIENGGDKVVPLIKTILAITKAYGIQTVAEGVETKGQCDILFELGCHIIQGGYYFSRPRTLTQIKDRERNLNNEG